MTPMPRVLLVEDEAHLAYALRFNLEAEGYAVTVAESLHAAEQASRDARFDLLLLDVMLPDGSGVDFCRGLRARGVRTPVLMLTAKAAPADQVEGLDAGADDYVAKPFERAVLLGRIAAVLRRSAWSAVAGGTMGRTRVGAGEVDFDARRAWSRGDEVPVTDLELRMLRYLVERPERVVSREELLQAVWGVSPRMLTRTVDNFVVRLRRYFEPDPSAPQLIQTVRGSGYRYVPLTTTGEPGGA